MIQILVVLFEMINIQCRIPTDWSKTIIVPIYKLKGSETDIANYRPIALSCTCRRIFEKTLAATEISPHMDKLSDFQNGFRARRSTLDQIFYLDEIMRFHKNTTQTFLDIRAVYDLVDRRLRWSQLHMDYNFSASLVKRLQMLFENNVSILRIQSSSSSPLPNLRGLLQGSSLSPFLFNFCVNSQLQRLNRPTTPRRLTI